MNKAKKRFKERVVANTGRGLPGVTLDNPEHPFGTPEEVDAVWRRQLEK